MKENEQLGMNMRHLPKNDNQKTMRKSYIIHTVCESSMNDPFDIFVHKFCCKSHVFRIEIR